MLYVIGLGLCDENDITVRGLEASTQASKGTSRSTLISYRQSGHPPGSTSKPTLVSSWFKRNVWQVDPPTSPETDTLTVFDAKEAFYGKPVILADRDMVETDSDAILRDADTQDVAFLVVGDPFGYVWVCLFLSSLTRRRARQRDNPY